MFSRYFQSSAIWSTWSWLPWARGQMYPGAIGYQDVVLVILAAKMRGDLPRTKASGKTRGYGRSDALRYCHPNSMLVGVFWGCWQLVRQKANLFRSAKFTSRDPFLQRRPSTTSPRIWPVDPSKGPGWASQSPGTIITSCIISRFFPAHKRLSPSSTRVSVWNTRQLIWKLTTLNNPMIF